MNTYAGFNPWELKAEFDYTNHRGERSKRRVRPLAIYLDVANQWHGTGYILRGYDLDKKAIREFSMKHIENWIERT